MPLRTLNPKMNNFFKDWLKRLFIFSYHGPDNHQTSYYRLKNLAETLAGHYTVYFVHGVFDDQAGDEVKYTTIPVKYKKEFLAKLCHHLIKKGCHNIAKTIIGLKYLFTRKDVFDLQAGFFTYINTYNIKITSNDIVLVSFPSHTVHELGYQLKKQFGCKLVLDYRDPGLFGYRPVADRWIESAIRKMLTKKSELKSLSGSDLIITVSESLKKFFPYNYQHKINIVRNGALTGKISSNSYVHPDKFRIVYLGTMYDAQLKDQLFFKVTKEFLKKYSIPPGQFELLFVGTDQSSLLKKVLSKYGLTQFSKITLRMSIEKAYDELYKASVFLHLKYGNRRHNITTKQYDYLAFGRPILLPETDHGDLAESIAKYDAGYVCQNPDELMNVLQTGYTNWKNGVPALTQRTEEEIYKLSRTYQAEKLLGYIKHL